MSPLPGKRAHMHLAPTSRKDILNSSIPNDYKKSAVLIAFFIKNELPHFIMIKRATDESIHSAQVAFPGGKMELNDGSLQNTALRESNEEIGLMPANVSMIGSLSDLYVPPSNFMITPYVGFLEKEPELNPNEEVAEILIIPLTELLDPRNHSEQQIRHRNDNIIVPCYTLVGKVVWGASAMILSELVEILQQDR